MAALSMHRRQPWQRLRGLEHAAAGLVSTVLWCMASSLLIICNKDLYDTGFAYPLMVTGIGQVFSAVTGLLLAAAGLMPLRKPPSTPSDWARLAPIIACTVLTMFYGNAAYMHLSMSFIQILKAFTPAVTLLIGAGVGVERLRGSLVAAVLLIAVGTGGAVLVESSTPSYSVYGLLLFLCSSLTEAGRVVCSQLLLGPYKFNSAEVLVYVGAPSALALVGGSLLLDGAPMLEFAGKLYATQPMIFLQAGAVSSMVNLASYLAISTTSSLTFKVAGCLKNLAVVWYGVAFRGDRVTQGHLLGYAVSVAGFVLYTYSKSAGLARHSARAGVQQQHKN
ncbi:triose-phosphate transporter family-domain-containing protein [Scenedesmus sp. NREL 46B-D3]|nr:triose-phosphate transporter family-domain-containing protein [Scenedesmus sp. NREL 46B-D3]